MSPWPWGTQHFQKGIPVVKTEVPAVTRTESSPLASCSFFLGPVSVPSPVWLFSDQPSESLQLDPLPSMVHESFSAGPFQPPPLCIDVLLTPSFLTPVLQCTLCLGPSVLLWWTSNHPSRPCSNAPGLERFPESPAEPIGPSTLSSASVSAVSPVLDSPLPTSLFLKVMHLRLWTLFCLSACLLPVLTASF